MKSLITSLATAITIFLANLFLLKKIATAPMLDASSIVVNVALALAIGVIAGSIFYFFNRAFSFKGIKKKARNQLSRPSGKKNKPNNSDIIFSIIIAHATFSFEYVFYPGSSEILSFVNEPNTLLVHSLLISILIFAVSLWLTYLDNRAKYKGLSKNEVSPTLYSGLLPGIIFTVFCISIIPAVISFKSHIDQKDQKNVAKIYDLASRQIMHSRELSQLVIYGNPDNQEELSSIFRLVDEEAAELYTLINLYITHHKLDSSLKNELPENSEIIILRENFVEIANDTIKHRDSVSHSGHISDLQVSTDTFAYAMKDAIGTYRSLEKKISYSQEHTNLSGLVIGPLCFLGLSLGLFWPLLQLIKAQRFALSHRIDEAESALVAKSQFLATMSHELRTPMNGVLGMVRLLIDSGLNEQQQKHASIALSSGDDLLIILNDILNYTKIESGQIELEKVVFSPRQLVQEVVALLGVQANAKGLNLGCSMHTRVPEHVYSDPTRIRQILINLVGNALKFTKTGDVQIRVLFKGDNARSKLIFEVIDTGVGVSKDAQTRIFEHFSQADETITRKFGGTGLGLAISRQLVGVMGGKIGVKSTVGFGSKFWFTVPVTLAKSPSQPTKEEKAVTGPTDSSGAQKLRVLIAEDNPVNQQILSAFVTAAGHQVTLVENGEKAVTAVHQEHFDVVLMDIQMPVLDGITATRQIRSITDSKGQIPIIAVTANAMEGDKEKYLDAGMNDYISKPVNPAKLEESMTRVFASQTDKIGVRAQVAI